MIQTKEAINTFRLDHTTRSQYFFLVQKRLNRRRARAHYQYTGYRHICCFFDKLQAGLCCRRLTFWIQIFSKTSMIILSFVWTIRRGLNNFSWFRSAQIGAERVHIISTGYRHICCFFDKLQASLCCRSLPFCIQISSKTSEIVPSFV